MLLFRATDVTLLRCEYGRLPEYVNNRMVDSFKCKKSSRNVRNKHIFI